MNPAVVDLLTRTFNAGALPHPGDDNRPPFVIPIPGFRASGMSDEQVAEMIGPAAKLWAEAIAHTLDTEFDIMTKADAAQLRQDAADAPDGTRIIRIHRGTKHGPIACELVIDKTDDAALPDAILREVS